MASSNVRTFAGLSCFAASVFLGPSGAAAQQKIGEWSRAEDPRYGYLIAYPANVFTPREGPAQEGGQVFVSRDGRAKLLIGTFLNEDGATLEEYREQILTENYAGALLDYAPVRRRSFVVSGTRGAMHFYEKVSFTCGGRLINSWALLYPADERRFYDRVVEAIAPTYSPGAGRTGECD